MDYEGLKSQRVMGDGWSDTKGCDKQKKEDDKLYAQLKESFFINLIILLQVKRGFLKKKPSTHFYKGRENNG